MQDLHAGVGCSDENWCCNASTVGKNIFRVFKMPYQQSATYFGFWTSSLWASSTKTSQIFFLLTAFLHSTLKESRGSLHSIEKALLKLLGPQYLPISDMHRLKDSNYNSLETKSCAKISDTMKAWDIWIGKYFSRINPFRKVRATACQWFLFMLYRMQGTLSSSPNIKLMYASCQKKGESITNYPTAFNFFFISMLVYHLYYQELGHDSSCSNAKISSVLRWLNTVFENSIVHHFDTFKQRIFMIYSRDIEVFIYFDVSTFKSY